MKKFLPVLQVLIFILTACNTVATPFSATQSPTPFPSLIPIPSATSTPIPNPTLDFNVSKIESLIVLDGFSISVPFPLKYQEQNNIVLIGNEEQSLTISFVGDEYDGVQPLMEVVDIYLTSIEKRGGQFTKSEPVQIQIDGVDGVSINLTGKLNNVDVQGVAVISSPRSNFVLVGLALSKTDSDKNVWENKDSAIFQSLLEEIKFTDVNASCLISTDQSYGYTAENPIKVGGGDYEGPSRERAYLDHLLGLNGEILSYDRDGSTMVSDLILDVFHVTGAGIDSTLYVDEYNFSELQAPVGFSCHGAFPLSAP